MVLCVQPFMRQVAGNLASLFEQMELEESHLNRSFLVGVKWTTSELGGAGRLDGLKTAPAVDLVSLAFFLQSINSSESLFVNSSKD